MFRVTSDVIEINYRLEAVVVGADAILVSIIVASYAWLYVRFFSVAPTYIDVKTFLRERVV